MKAVVVRKAGDSNVLELIQVDKPQVKSGWSLVKVMEFGINRSEIFTRQGLSPSITFPRILGIECVGVIEETTDEQRLPVGQKIISIMGEMGRDFDGSYAEYVLCQMSRFILSQRSWIGQRWRRFQRLIILPWCLSKFKITP